MDDSGSNEKVLRDQRLTHCEWRGSRISLYPAPEQSRLKNGIQARAVMTQPKPGDTTAQTIPEFASGDEYLPSDEFFHRLTNIRQELRASGGVIQNRVHDVDTDIVVSGRHDFLDRYRPSNRVFPEAIC